MPVYLLNQRLFFPSPQCASKEGLLAVGGDLSVKRLLLAYQMGIFPWYSEGDPVLWWSPDPRLVLYPEELHVPRRLERTLRQRRFKVTFDTAFEQVIAACSATRVEEGEGTWIVAEMIEAYCRLHRAGFAHSVEAWLDDRLAGGLYGVSLGRCFFGESMFTRITDASKSAFVTLVHQLKRCGFHLIDCQMTTTHLKRFGAREIARDRFLHQLQEALKEPTCMGKWGAKTA